MNEGYIAIWFMTMGVILYSTGWHEQVADQLSPRMLAIFLVGVFVLQFIEVPLGNHLFVKAGAIFALFVAVLSLFMLRHAGLIVFVFVASLMIGMIWMWMKYMYSTDPVFILFHPAWDGPLVAGVFSGLLCDRFRMQYAGLVIAAGIAQLHVLLHPMIGLQHSIMGALAWLDDLAIALMAARIIGNSKRWLHLKSLRLLEGTFGQKRGS